MVAFSKLAEPVQTEPFNNYYFYQRCWYNSFYNLFNSPDHLPKPGGSLHRLVAGALLTSEDIAIWGMKGYKDPKNYFDDYSASHVWIEDGEGRIWDILGEEYNTTIAQRIRLGGKCHNPRGVKVSKAIHIPTGGIEIEGMTSREIQSAYGFRYAPTTAEAQAHIIANAFAKWLPFKPYNFHTGKNYAEGWIGLALSAPTSKERMEKQNAWKLDCNFADAVLGLSATAQAYWRDLLKSPPDLLTYDYHIAEMGDVMLKGHGAETDFNLKVLLDTGVCFKPLGKVIAKAIDETVELNQIEAEIMRMLRA